MQKYVIVFGGELKNKGAQAMSFITVDEVAKRHPECRVVLVSAQDYVRDEAEKANYKFEILPFLNIKRVLALSSPFKKLVFKQDDLYQKYSNIIQNTIAVIDISGYALGSDWGATIATRIMLRVLLAKHNKIPYYFMPQSFGPFDFKGKQAPLANFMIKHYMKYPKVIYAREQAGKILLEEKYKLKNVKKSFDLVLQNKGIDEKNVYEKVPPIYLEEIADNSVAIIPNSKNIKFGDGKELNLCYKEIINFLLEQEKNVYFVYHAIEDLEVCKQIKNEFFKEDSRIKIVEKELSCIEFDKIVSKFDYVIASRYHSIVHAYKESVPAVIFGWAIKYCELSSAFNQQQYQFDVRRKLNVSEILSKLRHMDENYKEESKTIKNILVDIQKDNVFDVI